MVYSYRSVLVCLSATINTLRKDYTQSDRSNLGTPHSDGYFILCLKGNVWNIATHQMVTHRLWPSVFRWCGNVLPTRTIQICDFQEPHRIDRSCCCLDCSSIGYRIQRSFRDIGIIHGNSNRIRDSCQSEMGHKTPDNTSNVVLGVDQLQHLFDSYFGFSHFE